VAGKVKVMRAQFEPGTTGSREFYRLLTAGDGGWSNSISYCAGSGDRSFRSLRIRDCGSAWFGAVNTLPLASGQ
jgi:hypothetical protein